MIRSTAKFKVAALLISGDANTAAAKGHPLD